MRKRSHNELTLKWAAGIAVFGGSIILLGLVMILYEVYFGESSDWACLPFIVFVWLFLAFCIGSIIWGVSTLLRP